MAQVSNRIRQRFGLSQLDASWQRWFDSDWATVPLAGAFRSPRDPIGLLESRPEHIWSGFMLPDSIPILGNAYGDWFCVRVNADGGLGELLHWYHGGGDWIPLGESLVGACLHDAVDQFRPPASQMLRGALETLDVGHQLDVWSRLSSGDFQQWVESEFGQLQASAGGVAAKLAEFFHLPFDASQANNPAGNPGEYYDQGLTALESAGIAMDAIACDRIEACLQTVVQSLADKALATSAGVVWSPDYLRFLFDIEHADESVRQRVLNRLSQDSGINTLPAQDWQQAEQLALQVLARRTDLAWAFDIAGWAAERRGNYSQAIHYYQAGLRASPFSDQSVRLRSHWYTADSPKFACCRLKDLAEHVTDRHQQDAYGVLAAKTSGTGASEISGFWINEAVALEQSGEPEKAYWAYYKAGWDVGVARLADYQRILTGLVTTARSAGWSARHQVAQMHLDCLRR